jgi:hypothetical protein
VSKVFKDPRELREPRVRSVLRAQRVPPALPALKVHKDRLALLV